MLSVYSMHGNTEIEARVLDETLGNPNVLGVIYATVFTRRVTVPAALAKVPTVLLNCYANDANVSSVVPAEVAGGHAVTDHLLAAGHRRIGYINGEPWQDAARDRLKGYRTALATADLPFTPEMVCEGDWGRPATGFEATLSLIREPNPPTAIFCANDLMAIGAIEAAIKQLGLRVPDDVSVLGYDDQEIARHTHPPLSTVVLPNYDLGRWAVETLLQEEHNCATGAPVRRRTVKLDGPLIERGSVRVLAEAQQGQQLATNKPLIILTTDRSSNSCSCSSVDRATQASASQKDRKKQPSLPIGGRHAVAKQETGPAPARRRTDRTHARRRLVRRACR